MVNSTPVKKLEQEQIKALQRLDFKKVQKFIEQGMDVNKVFTVEGGMRPIHLVVPFKYREEGPVVLEYLLARDDIEVDGLDTFGNTALMYAAIHGNLSACRLLIQHGANYRLKSQQFKKNAIELFKENHIGSFHSFETIIKEYEETIKAEANSDAKIVDEEAHYPNMTPDLKQRKHEKNGIIGSPHSTSVGYYAQQGGAKSYKLSFWRIVNCFRRHPAPTEAPYIPLKNTASQNSPKLNKP